MVAATASVQLGDHSNCCTSPFPSKCKTLQYSRSELRTAPCPLTHWFPSHTISPLLTSVRKTQACCQKSCTHQNFGKQLAATKARHAPFRTEYCRRLCPCHVVVWRVRVERHSRATADIACIRPVPTRNGRIGSHYYRHSRTIENQDVFFETAHKCRTNQGPRGEGLRKTYMDEPPLHAQHVVPPRM